MESVVKTTLENLAIECSGYIETELEIIKIEKTGLSFNHQVLKAAEKAKREEYLAEMEEREHVKNMIEKWGAHRWYNMVSYTDDDCDTAQKLRDEEEEREYQQEKWYEEQERQWEKEYDQQKIADEKYIAEKTANMSEKEKELFISEFEEERMRWLEDGMEAEGDIWYRDFQHMEKQNKQDAERLAAWQAKNKN